LGGAKAEACRNAGHEVWILTRGLRDADSIRRINGDRSRPLPDLSSHRFDAVLDSCAYTPAMVDHLLDAVGPAIGRYVFISSNSVYCDLSLPGADENSPTKAATAPRHMTTPMVRSKDPRNWPPSGV
jgi:2'-hydroxyisoflavone reductase